MLLMWCFFDIRCILLSFLNMNKLVPAKWNLIITSLENNHGDTGLPRASILKAEIKIESNWIIGGLEIS